MEHPPALHELACADGLAAEDAKGRCCKEWCFGRHHGRPLHRDGEHEAQDSQAGRDRRLLRGLPEPSHAAEHGLPGQLFAHLAAAHLVDQRGQAAQGAGAAPGRAPPDRGPLGDQRARQLHHLLHGGAALRERNRPVGRQPATGHRQDAASHRGMVAAAVPARASLLRQQHEPAAVLAGRGTQRCAEHERQRLAAPPSLCPVQRLRRLRAQAAGDAAG
mmetsp:Transcript_36832/g.97531  ORF Transcript_36832/g.97531 Transcript_36832/m.97531 type:complete len:218 (+) Transcript_36832:121-774(+)